MDNLYFPFDATSSWAGYDIQGKMTVYFILREIDKVIDSNELNNFKDLLEILSRIFIELEKMEDIAIIENEEYREIFQVKAGESTKLKAADCYNLCIAAYKEGMIQSSDNANAEGDKRCTYLISTHDLDKIEEIRSLGQEHLKILVGTDYSELIEVKKISEIPFYKTKASFGSLYRKLKIIDIPIKNRKEKIEAEIIAPLTEVLNVFDNLSINIFPSKIIKDSDTIRKTCIELIANIKNKIKVRFPDNVEIKNLIEKKDDFIYWNLVNLLDIALFFKESTGEVGVRVRVDDFLLAICEPINEQIDEIQFISHILRDKIYKELKSIPEYFQEKGIIKCPSEATSCVSCVNNMNCNFMVKVRMILQMENEAILKLFKRMMLHENSNLRNINNLPTDAQIESQIFKNMAKYEKFSFENGFPETRVGKSEGARMIAEMSTWDTSGRIVQKLNELSNTDIKFIEQLFESKFLFHMHDEGAVPSFLFGNDEKFIDISSKDLTLEEARKLKFLKSDYNYKFTGTSTIKVIGTDEAEEKLNERAD